VIRLLEERESRRQGIAERLEQAWERLQRK
jgi:hypothetical protein